jgi:hypothetical protein
MGTISNIIRELRMAAAKAKRTLDRTGQFDTTTVYFAIPAHVALMVANRLEQTEDRMVGAAKARSEMKEIAGIAREAVDLAEETMKDINLRFHYAMTDLELFLETAVGRPPMTMQEVREQRQIMEARPSPGPQPFIRKKPPMQASNELLRSIRERRIGNPREPGEDG